MPTAGTQVVTLPPRTWQSRAACRDLDPDLFTPGEREGEDAQHLQDAALFCHQAPCPVLAECLQWALDNEEETGVWGGKLATEREAMLAAQGRSG